MCIYYKVLHSISLFTQVPKFYLYFDDYGKTLWQVFDTYNFYGNIYCNTLSEQKNYLEPLFNGFGNTYIGQVISDVVVPNNTTSQVTINWLVDSTLSIPLAVKDKIKIIRKTGSSQIIYT